MDNHFPRGYIDVINRLSQLSPKLFLSKVNIFVTIVIGILLLVAIYVGANFSRQRLYGVNKNLETTPPSPTLQMMSNKNLKKFANGRIAFLYPKVWERNQDPTFEEDVYANSLYEKRYGKKLKYVTKFEHQSTVFFTISEFHTLIGPSGDTHEIYRYKDYLGPKAREITIAGFRAKRSYDPGIAGHTLPHEKVAVFGPNEGDIIELYFTNPDATIDHETAVSKWFEPLLSSIVISAIPVAEVLPDLSTDQIYRMTYPKKTVNITSSSPFNKASWIQYVDDIYEFSMSYPNNWNREQAQFTDYHTVIFTSRLDASTRFGIGENIFSRSGDLCGNESFCEEVGKIAVNIKGTQYFSTLYEVGTIYGTQTDNPKPQFEGYRFEMSIDNMKSIPLISGQFTTLEEGQEIVEMATTIQ